MIRTVIRAVLVVGVALNSASAAEKAADAAHLRKLAADHRVIANAHAAAAACLESGKAEKLCHEELAKSCRDVAIGKYCGMRQHRH